MSSVLPIRVALAALCGAVAACSSVAPIPTETPAAHVQLEGGSGGGGGGGGGGSGGGGGATAPACVDDGTLTALSYLSTGPWTTVAPDGSTWKFTFTVKGQWEWFRLGPNNSQTSLGKGSWVQPMLQLYRDVTPVITGPATSINHCQFTWQTSQHGTLLMTRS